MRQTNFLRFINSFNTSQTRNGLRGILVRCLPYGICAAALWALGVSPVRESLNLLVYDLVATKQERKEQKPNTAFEEPVVIGIDERDIALYGWPLHDNLLCEAIQRITASGASAIGLDLYRNQSFPVDNTCLQKAVKTNSKLISIRNIAEDIPAIPGTPARQQGFSDLLVDPDRVVRRDLVHVTGQTLDIRSFALRLLETARNQTNLAEQIESLPEEAWLTPNAGGYGDLPAAGYQTMLALPGIKAIQTWSLRDLLNGTISDRALKNKIVVIGASAESVKDVFEVPHSRFGQSDSFLYVPGAEIHAWRVIGLNYLLEHRKPRLQAIPEGRLHRIAFLLFFLGILLAEAPRNIRQATISLLVGSVVVASVIVLMQRNHALWMGITLPTAAVMMSGSTGLLRRGLASQQQQQQMRRLLGQTSSPAVAEQLWERRDELLEDGRFRGREQQVTILFSDTCNFTSVSEQLSPSELMHWLNKGISIAVDAVTQRGGMVNKFTGDGMLAVFGAPLSEGDERDAQRAIEAAQDIQHQFLKLNHELSAEQAQPMRLRIGIHSGVVLTGSLGNSQRLEYAVIGDSVNCASRLESYEKQRQTNLVRVLVSSSTRELLGKLDEQLPWEDWGELSVKGRQEPLHVFELKDSAPAADSASRSQ